MGNCQRMDNCLTGSDFKELGDSMILDFDRRIANIPSELCGPFHHEASRLEDGLLNIYKVMVLHVRRLDDLERIAEAWSVMVMVCDEAARKLHSLQEAHPHCGAQYYYDRVLDLRNKCQRIQMMHT
jgi:hypothetical protein